MLHNSINILHQNTWKLNYQRLLHHNQNLSKVIQTVTILKCLKVLVIQLDDTKSYIKDKKKDLGYKIKAFKF